MMGGGVFETHELFTLDAVCALQGAALEVMLHNSSLSPPIPSALLSAEFATHCIADPMQNDPSGALNPAICSNQ